MILGMTPEKKAEIQKIMKRSGNSLHSEVVRQLRGDGWNVLVSPYYSDNFTKKPREIDIIAEKEFLVADIFSHRTFGTVKARLLIECKYIVGDTVFWFDARDKTRAIDRIMSDSELDHPDNNIGVRSHHYYSDEAVAKLVSSGSKGNEDNEIMNKSINQSLNALVYYRKRSDIFPSKATRNAVLRTFAYPLIVTNSFEKFYRTDMAMSDSIAPIAAPFQLEVNYAYLDADKKPCNEYFLIDVLSVDKLSSFTDSLEKADIHVIIEHARWTEERRQSPQ